MITFLPRSKGLLISWLQSPSAVTLEPPKIKSVIVSIVSSSICHELMGPDAMIFSKCCTLLFHFHQRLFCSSSLSAIRVVSSAYLRLLIFLSTILILACASSSPAFFMIYSVCKCTPKFGSILSAMATCELGCPEMDFISLLLPCCLIEDLAYSGYFRNICECLYWVRDNQRSFLCPPCHRATSHFQCAHYATAVSKFTAPFTPVTSGEKTSLGTSFWNLL